MRNKNVKKEDRRAAREPRPPTEELIRQLSEYDLSVGELALRLRETVFEEAPDANEIVYKSYALTLIYSFTPRWTDSFCYIGVYSKHINLGFLRGTELDDPKGLLAGSGKRMRHIKIKTADDLKKPHHRAFIKAAIKHSQIDPAAPRPKRSKPVQKRRPTAARRAK